MKLYELEVDGRNTIKFSENLFPTKKVSLIQNVPNECTKIELETIGGILRNGELAWMAHGKMLRILSLRNSQIISTFEFSESLGYEGNCSIKSVEELFLDDIDNSMLGILIENVELKRGDSRNYLCVYSVMLTSILSIIDLPLRGTCIKFIGPKACRRNILQNFDGCIAVGTMEGVLLLVDLKIRKTMLAVNELQLNAFVPYQIVNCNTSLSEIHRTFRTCQQDGIHFILQMEVVQKPTKICSIQPIDEALGVAIGLEDGRLIYFDLVELQIIYIVAPLPNLREHSIVHMTYLKECRTVKPCIYLWAILENCNNLYVVMYILNYTTWKIDATADIFEPLEKCSIDFQMRLDVTSSYISCQALRLKLPFNAESEYRNICTFSWFSHEEEKNKILIFDLTMYYQEDNATNINYCDNAYKQATDGNNLKYLSHYILNGTCKGYDIWFNPDTLTPFISPKSSYESSVYPNSISFDCSMLHYDGCRRYNWEGAQSQFINILRTSNASIFLEYRKFYDSILKVGLLNPQEIQLHTEENRKRQYEVILSIALEYNCMGLLRDCARSWIDGSFMGNSRFATDLSLSTLTDWAWKTFKQLRECCDNLKSIALDGNALNNNGTINSYFRCHEELIFKSRQMKLLAELFQYILLHSKRQIPERVFLLLKQQQQKMHSIANYYNLLLWLINIGILPELPVHDRSACNTNKNNIKNQKVVVYPYIDLRNFYKTKRASFRTICNNCIVDKTGHCRLLYIDYLLEYQCKIQSNKLYSYWYKGKGEPVYPPYSVQSVIDIILIPDIAEDIKYAVLLYFLLDLNMVIDETQYKDIMINLIKFPSVFKLSPQLIKTVQSFWNLDHGHFVLAIDEFISPFNKDQKYEHWHIELLLEVLLIQNVSHLALRLLETQAHLITPELKLKMLLYNDLISEAFHFARSKYNGKLLELFFIISLNRGQFSVIRDLALTDQEGSILQDVLKTKKFPGTESLHFIYLLQKSKYLEAVTYLDELSKVKTLRSLHLPNNYNEMEAPNLVLSAFNTTLTPITQNLTDTYFKIKNKIKQKELNNNSPLPLSCQLTKQNANNLLGGIYHSSALSTHFATYYWNERNNCENINEASNVKQFMSSNNAPFLRPLQTDNSSRAVLSEAIKYPTMYKVTEKRTFTEREMHDFSYDNINNIQSDDENPCKRRRLANTEIFENFQNNANKIYPAIKKGRETYTLTHITNDKTPVDFNNEFSGTRSKDVHNTLKTINTDMTENETLAIKYNDNHNSIYSNYRRQLSDFSNNQQLTRTNFEEYASQERLNKQSIVDDGSDGSEYKSNINRERVCTAAADDDYYSLIDSANTSVAISDSHKNNTDLSDLTKKSLLSGPQPRKPLSRLSAETNESLKSQHLVNANEPHIFTSKNDLNEEEELSKVVDQPVIDHLKSIDNNVRKYSDIKVSKHVDNFLPKITFTNTESSSEIVSSYRDIVINQKVSVQLGIDDLINDDSSGSDTHASDNSAKLNEFVSNVVSSATYETILNVCATPKKQQFECSTISNSPKIITDDNVMMSNEEKSTMAEKEYNAIDTAVSISPLPLTFSNSMIHSNNDHSTPVSDGKGEKFCDNTNQSREDLPDAEGVYIKVKNAEKNKEIQDEIDLLYGDLNNSGSDDPIPKTRNQCLTDRTEEASLMENDRNRGSSNESKNKTEDVCMMLTSSSDDGLLATSIRQGNDIGILLLDESSKYTNGNYDNEDSNTYESIENLNKDKLGESDAVIDYDNNEFMDCSDDTNVVEISQDSSIECEARNTKECEIVVIKQNASSNGYSSVKIDEEKTSVATGDIEESKNPSFTNIEARLEEQIDTNKEKFITENIIHVEKKNVQIVEVVEYIKSVEAVANTSNIESVESVSYVENNVEIAAKLVNDLNTINMQSVVEAAVLDLIPENVQFKILEKGENDMSSGEKEINKNIRTTKEFKDISIEMSETNEDASISLQIEKADDKKVVESMDHKMEHIYNYSNDNKSTQQTHDELKVSVRLNSDCFSKENPNYIVKSDNGKVEIDKKGDVTSTKENYDSDFSTIDVMNGAALEEFYLCKQKIVPKDTKRSERELINENFTAENNNAMSTSRIVESKLELTDKLGQRSDVTRDKNGEKLEKFQGAQKKSVNVNIRKRYFLRGRSEPPIELQNNPSSSHISQVHSNKRCGSLPPESQVINLQLRLGVRPRARAASLQNQEKRSGLTASPTVSSMPVKVLKRRRSSILESIPEDSPSARTRSRLRLNSVESEPDSMNQRKSKRICQMKGITQRRRRDSSSSNIEVMNARSSSVSLTENEDESIPPTPSSGTKRRSLSKHKSNIGVASENSEHPPSLRITATDDNLLYSSERRLTRNQRALLEKSNVLAQNLHLDHELSTTPSTSLKTTSKTRPIRSVATGGRNDSDDNESMSSRQSNTSNPSFSNRRVTRSSTKNKDEIDDDSHSVASSSGSDRQFRSQRYKDKKSPNTTLSSIPEDSLDESVQDYRRRGTRDTKQ